MFTDGHLPLDVALVQVAPPDADGMCSLGVSVDITRAAVLAATTVIAEVNPAMPRTRGDSLIPADRIDHAVLVDTPVTEYLHEPVEGVGRADRPLRRPPRRRQVDPADRSGPRAQPDAPAPEEPARPLRALRGDHRARRRPGRAGRDHRSRGRQLGDGHPAALRPARLRRAVLAAHRSSTSATRRRSPGTNAWCRSPRRSRSTSPARCAPSCSTASCTAGCRPGRTSTGAPSVRPTARP